MSYATLTRRLTALLSLISGNEAHFSLETASDYVKDEKACFYGFKCVAVGYEFNPGLDEVWNSIWMCLKREPNAWNEVLTFEEPIYPIVLPSVALRC